MVYSYLYKSIIYKSNNMLFVLINNYKLYFNQNENQFFNITNTLITIAFFIYIKLIIIT